LMFVLTGGDVFNYEGTAHWLTTVDSRVLDTIDFALCLDAIAYGNEGLYFHVSKPPKDEAMGKVFNNFLKSAETAKIPLQLVHKKVNMSDTEIYWRHELFSRKRILSATLSHHSAPQPHFARSSVFDTKESINKEHLEKAIKLVAESLAKYVFSHTETEVEVFSGSLGLNKDFISSWLNALSSTPRFAPFIPSSSPLLEGIQAALREYTGTVSNQSFTYTSDYTFYGSTSGSMHAYKAKPIAFDFILAGMILCYFAVLYTALKGPAEAVKSVKRLFASNERKIYKKKEK